MSQLAFNIHGERFEPPGDMVFWRVRRLKPGGRGVPEVVFGSDGLPLVVSSEADVDEFRRLVRNVPGRYRLDPVDVDQKACEDGVPAYVSFEALAESEGEAESSGNDDLLRTVIAANTEMVRCMTEKFAAVMDSAATLLRAADGAGMPQREAKVIDVEVRNAAAPEPEDRDESEAEVAMILRSAIDKVMPIVGHTINTRVLGLSNAQSVALLGGGRAAEPTDGETTIDDADTNPRIELPPPDFMTHLAAIEAELDKTEVALVRTAVMQMNQETLEAYKDKLMSLSVEDAAQVVRDEVAKRRPS